MNLCSTWEAAIGAWVRHMQAGGLPESTIGLRAYHMSRIAKELGGTPSRVTLAVLETWLVAHAWSPNTRRTYRASLRAFYAHFTKGKVEESPAHALPPVRVPRARPRPTPEKAYRLAMRSADARARLGIMLAGVCGLRVGEISRTKREHLEEDLEGWSLRVTGKGGHVRMVPLPEEIAREIHTRPPGWLFPSTQGGHLTPHHLGKVISRWLPEGYTTHTLRHRAGTVAYANTRDLRAVQELLGHAKPETTAIYTQVPGSAIRAAVESAL